MAAARGSRRGGVAVRTIDQRTNYLRHDLVRALVDTAIRSFKHDRKLLSEYESKKTLRLKRKIGGRSGH